MSKFFIDSDDGTFEVIDDEGLEMADADAAREAANGPRSEGSDRAPTARKSVTSGVA